MLDFEEKLSNGFHYHSYNFEIKLGDIAKDILESVNKPVNTKCSWHEFVKDRIDNIVYKVVDPDHEDANKLKNIVKTIISFEDNLSDGFSYYGDEVETLGDIAKKILATLNEEEPVDEESVSEYEESVSVDEEAEMDDIEAELAAEDENLVSVDWRYIKTIEEENMYLHCEVARLRQALENLNKKADQYECEKDA